MEDIIIRKNENEHNGWFVEQGDKVSCECGWDEMMGLIAALTMPNDRGCLRWMKSKPKPYVPRNGDFVITNFKGTKCVAIFRNWDNTQKNCKWEVINYHAICLLNGVAGIDKALINDKYICEGIIRPATEEERNQLLSKLHEIGKDWDEEEKEIVDWEWEPKDGEEYHTLLFDKIVGFYSVYQKWSGDVSDKFNKSKGWVFRTREECNLFRDKLNKEINNAK